MTDQPLKYDVVIVGAGIAGLWLGARLRRNGFNVIVIDKNSIGGIQTLASQGMIHGGQKYTLTGAADQAASAIATMPERWQACFDGYGELDLTAVQFTSDDQVMWSAGGKVSSAAVFAAAKTVNAGTKKLKPAAYPDVLSDMHRQKKFKGTVYRLPEKVLDVKTLVSTLAEQLQGRIFQGTVTEARPDGQLAVDGQILRAQAIIFTSGAGNEDALRMMKAKNIRTQRRPLRQVMIKTLPFDLNGHGIIVHPKPRVTVTSHRIGPGAYVWYLGGNIAEQGANLNEEETLRFARNEMNEMFPLIDWNALQWSTWYGERAEPLTKDGRLPPGPHIQQRGHVLLAWPVKLTFTPLLSDQVMEWLERRKMMPLLKTADMPSLPLAPMGTFPWETATWKM